MRDDDGASLALAETRDTKRGVCPPRSRLQGVHGRVYTADLKDAKTLLDELEDGR